MVVVERYAGPELQRVLPRGLHHVRPWSLSTSVLLYVGLGTFDWAVECAAVCSLVLCLALTELIDQGVRLGVIGLCFVLRYAVVVRSGRFGVPHDIRRSSAIFSPAGWVYMPKERNEPLMPLMILVISCGHRNSSATTRDDSQRSKSSAVSHISIGSSQF